MPKGLKNLICVTLLIFTIQSASDAEAVSIDLNDFFADPTVSVAPDGSSAFFTEEDPFFTVLLANDPGLGDPNVIIPGPGILLTFDFNFVEAAGEDDEFGAFVIDGSGLSAGPLFEFFTSDTSSGTVTFDLTTLTGDTLGLQFQLASGFFDTGFGSTLTVSNVNLAPIPEPSTMLLLGSGLAGLGLLRRRRKTA